MDELRDSRESAHAFPISGEADPSFLLLLRQALGERQDRLRGPEIEPSPTEDKPPVERIGRFEVIEVLGRGGYGTVLRVRDLKLGCERAMKLPNPETLASPRSLARFMDEARKAVLIDHPNVVRVLEADEVFSLCYMVMEYCPGGSLSGWLARRPTDRPIPPRWAAALVAEIADGVRQAHAAGLLHRDLKPGNVMLVRVDDRSESDPPRFHPKVGDFGLAKALFDSPNQVEQTVSGTMIGTLAYMSPEQARGDKAIREASDIYGLGAILYELLTRKTPFPGSSEAEVLARILDDAPPPSPRSIRPDLPRDLETICRTALAKRPGDRYATAAELADDLRRFLRNDPVKGSPWYKRARATLRQHRLRAAVAGLVLTPVVVSAIAWYLVHDTKRRSAVEDQLNKLESATANKFPDLIPKINLTDPNIVNRLIKLVLTGTENQQLGAALTLAKVSRDHGEYCYKRLLKASPDEIVPVARLLSYRMKDLPSRLGEELEAHPSSLSRLAEERDPELANAACALLALGNDDRGWSLLRLTPDPQARSFLIHLLVPAGIEPQKIVARLKVEPDVSIRRALIQSLGEVPASAWSQADHEWVRSHLLYLYEDDPDPGIHGSAKWLLHRWGMAEALREIDTRLARRPQGPDFRWRIGPMGLTFITIDDAKLDRIIEVSDTEITVDQFLAHSPKHDFNRTISSDGQSPINAISYVDAAAFCNWLSEREGLAREHWCYQPQVDKPKYLASIRAYQDQSGYRLLEVGEAQLAARAGTSSRCFYGGSEELLGNYAWSLENSSGKAHRVGQLKPNDFGLFDVLGNVREWCEATKWDATGMNQPLIGHSILAPRSGFDQSGSNPGQTSAKYSHFPTDGFRVARTVRIRRHPGRP